MKIEINDYCIRCGLCIDLYPDLFSRNWEDKVIEVVTPIPEGSEDRAKQAALDCAVAAMKVIK